MIQRVMVPAALAAVALLGAAPFVRPPDSVKAVMEAANKGKESLYNKVVEGKGTPEDAVKLSEYYQLLPGMKVTKGDAKSWTEKATALAAAAKDVADKKPGALEKLKTAGNCKACHSVHKPAK